VDPHGTNFKESDKKDSLSVAPSPTPPTNTVRPPHGTPGDDRPDGCSAHAGVTRTTSAPAPAAHCGQPRPGPGTRT
jgi:hypothetical protein